MSAVGKGAALVHHRMFSTPEGYHEYTVDNLSTLQGAQYRSGDLMSTLGAHREYTRVCSVPQRDQ